MSTRSSRWMAVAAVIAVVSVAGCSTARQTVVKAEPASSAPVAKASPAPAPEARQEVATGEVREALLVLRRVHFALDSDRLLPEARTALAEAAATLRAHPGVEVQVDGHADARGSAEHNLSLGKRRAEAARAELVRLGIAPERLRVKTFGRDQPLAAGHDALAYAQNRRAEFRLMRGEVRLVVEEGTLVDDRGRALQPTQVGRQVPAGERLTLR